MWRQSVFRAVLVLAALFAASPFSNAQSDKYWQQQQAQRQRAQQQQQFDEQRRQAQLRIQEEQRQRVREGQQQVMRERARSDAQNKAKADELQKKFNSVARDADRLQRDRGLGRIDPVTNKPTAIRADGNLKRPLTTAEISRGFTGKVTANGRALIKYQGRVFAVPASRISGLTSRLALKNSVAHAPKTPLSDRIQSQALNENYREKLSSRVSAAKAARTDQNRSVQSTKSTAAPSRDDVSAAVLRNSPGTAVSSGSTTIHVRGNWFRGSQGNLGLFPSQLAEKMIGKNYRNFDDFRQDFWRNAAAVPELASQFTPSNLALMKSGQAPFAPLEQQLGGQKRYILHHKTPINQGGGVYDVDNIVVVSPLYHKDTLEKDFHYGK